VAHYDHGIRPDSKEDEILVRGTAKDYGLQYEVGRGHLGKNTSEEQARKHRYNFLGSVKSKHAANAIVTAHHQDDLIETAFINILRGSGPRGLVAMKINPSVKRPLINATKKDIYEYARKNSIKWREDTTNQDENYLRNYLRRNIMPSLSGGTRSKITADIEKIAAGIEEKNNLIATISQDIIHNKDILRNKYVVLPLEIRGELIAFWLRSYKFGDFNKKTLESIDLILKTGKAGSKYPIRSKLWLELGKNTARFNYHT
jgi:tRNA(Ile)-lysidine synthase